MKPSPLILIVDDDQAITDLLTELFKIEGYKTISTNWGHEALSIVEKRHPDLVIMDIMLPDINGLEVTKRLRAKRGSAFTPVIFLSESAEREQRLRGLSLGAEDFIAKPFDVEELILRVRNVLTRFAHAAQTNPISGLPENTLLDSVMALCLQSRDRLILVISILNMAQIRESQGFIKSDQRLRQIATHLNSVVQEYGDSASVVGQTGPYQFILLMPDSFSAKQIDSLQATLQSMVDFSGRKVDNQSTEIIVEAVLKTYGQTAQDINSVGDLRDLLEALASGDA